MVTDKPTAKDIAEAKRIEAERIAEAERQRAEEQRQFELAKEQFKSGLGVNGVYKIGDYYNRNGKEGIVYSVSDDGMHGKIVSLDEYKVNGSERIYNKSDYDKYYPVTNDYNGEENTDVIIRCCEEEKFYPGFISNIGKMRRAGWFIPALDDVKLIKQRKDLINVGLFILEKGELCKYGIGLLSSTLESYEGLSGLVSVLNFDMKEITFKENSFGPFCLRYVSYF